MPPKRNTPHLARTVDTSMCGRHRGIFTPCILSREQFEAVLKHPTNVVCRKCLDAYVRPVDRPSRSGH